MNNFETMLIKLINIFIIILFTGTNFVFAGQSGSFCKRQELGWHFYCDERKQQRSVLQKNVKKKSGAEVVKQQKANLEQLFHEALVYPTEENILNYIHHKKKYAFDQASEFTRQYQFTMWKNADLDQNVITPVNSIGKNVWLNNRKQQQQELLANFNDNYGLFFVFSSTCPYCHAYAPVLKQLENYYGVKVKGISIDGSCLPEFENAVIDTGQLANIGIRTDTVPATFLFSKDTQDMTALGAGALSESELIERIYQVIQFKKGNGYGNF